MAIKRFDDAQDKPEPEPKAEAKSIFDPFATKQDSSQHGTRVFADGQAENKYTDQEELMEAMLGSVQGGFKDIKELIFLFQNTVVNPTRDNVLKYTAKLNEVAGPEQRSRTALSMCISMIVDSLNKR